MEPPADLPHMVEWLLPGPDGRATVLKSLPRRGVRSVGSGGATDAAIVRPRIPYGAAGWRLPREAAWRALAEIPESWRAFLERVKP